MGFRPLRWVPPVRGAAPSAVLLACDAGFRLAVPARPTGDRDPLPEAGRRRLRSRLGWAQGWARRGRGPHGPRGAAAGSAPATPWGRPRAAPPRAGAGRDGRGGAGHRAPAPPAPRPPAAPAHP